MIKLPTVISIIRNEDGSYTVQQCYDNCDTFTLLRINTPPDIISAILHMIMKIDKPVVEGMNYAESTSGSHSKC
jgi:hypothetical protein